MRKDNRYGLVRYRYLSSHFGDRERPIKFDPIKSKRENKIKENEERVLTAKTRARFRIVLVKQDAPKVYS